VRLPDGSGVELCRELRAKLPGLRCLMLTSFTDEQAMVDAVQAGADGFVLKDIDGLRLVDAIRRVGSGSTLLDGRAVAALMAKLGLERRSQAAVLVTALRREERRPAG